MPRLDLEGLGRALEEQIALPDIDELARRGRQQRRRRTTTAITAAAAAVIAVVAFGVTQLDDWVGSSPEPATPTIRTEVTDTHTDATGDFNAKADATEVTYHRTTTDITADVHIPGLDPADLVGTMLYVDAPKVGKHYTVGRDPLAKGLKKPVLAVDDDRPQLARELPCPGLESTYEDPVYHFSIPLSCMPDRDQALRITTSVDVMVGKRTLTDEVTPSKLLEPVDPQ